MYYNDIYVLKILCDLLTLWRKEEIKLGLLKDASPKGPNVLPPVRLSANFYKKRIALQVEWVACLEYQEAWRSGPDVVFFLVNDGFHRIDNGENDGGI